MFLMEATIMFTFTSHVNHKSYEVKIQRLVHVESHQTEKGATKKFNKYLEDEFHEWGHIDGNNGNAMKILNITNKTLL